MGSGSIREPEPPARMTACVWVGIAVGEGDEFVLAEAASDG